MPTPEGWVWISLGTVDLHLVPDVHHPDHPYTMANRKSPHFKRLLESDEETQAFIRKLRPVLATEENDPFPNAVFRAINDFSKTQGPDEVPWSIKNIYILKTAFEDGVFDEASIAASLAPLHISLTREGTFVMSFTSASQSERKGFSKLIENAQPALGYRKPPGGRPKKREDPVSTEHARMAAKLHHWPSPSWAHDAIAELFGWNGNVDARRERVRRAIREGEILLLSEMGKNWENNPPPKIAERDD